MKKDLIFLMFGLNLVFTTDIAKLDQLTNFSNFKKYKINIDTAKYTNKFSKIDSSLITNGIFSYFGYPFFSFFNLLFFLKNYSLIFFICYW